MSDGGKLLLNEKEAAELLSMSTHFLRRDRISDRSAGIPFIRIGAAIRYRRADLEVWIEARMHRPVCVEKVSVQPIDLGQPEKRRRGRPIKSRQVVCL
jgi:hypothetical protein